MQRDSGRAELIDRLLPELHQDGDRQEEAPELLDAFTREVLRRVDDKYLYRHRMTTLGAQLRESFQWIRKLPCREHAHVRVFQPTEEEHGYELEGWVIETLMPDQPFIVDTLNLYLDQRHIQVLNRLHVVLPVSFDDGARIGRVESRSSGSRHVSYTRWYVDWGSADLTPELVREEVAARLDLARAMVRDFYRMIRTIKGIANDFDYLAKVDPEHREECDEVRSFLEWLVDEHFVFMGVSFYRLDGDAGGEPRVQLEPERGLGAMHGDERPSGDSTEDTLAFIRGSEGLDSPLVRVRKSHEESLVHRSGKVDEVLVRRFDDRGRPDGGVVIHGLFTFKGLGEPGSRIPILRRKLEHIVDDEGAVRGGWDHKALVNAYNTLPVEFLFEADRETIRGLLEMSIAADTTRHVQSRVVFNGDARSAYVFLVIPKEQYSDELRADMQEMLTRDLNASYADHRVHLGKFGAVGLHFYLTGNEDFGASDIEAIERQLVEMGTPWSFRLRQSLEAHYRDDARAAQVYARYADAFPESYTEITPVEDAVNDIHHLERVAETGRIRFDLLPEPEEPERARLRIYSREAMELTSILPIVDNFGVVVIEQYAFTVQPRRSEPLTVNTLRVRRGAEDLLSQREALIDALRAVFIGRMPSDPLNRLLLAARLTWRETDLCRAYAQYSRQLGHQIDPGIIQRILVAHGDYVALLVRLFHLWFQPDAAPDEATREARADRTLEEARSYLAEVHGVVEDRVLRIFRDLIEATIRTNFYRERDDGEHVLSFKVDCRRVSEMPDPRPMFEIYVHHARMEGVHLRAGRVARGGIRWSDRLDDYRSEILGLMATQQLKNSLIVPVGAKGGFILRDAPDDPARARREADELYRVFVRGLLELTDDLREGRVTPPERVRRYDDDDPYLVVAPDKGTAHLSDVANDVALGRGFWLGDAFASSGSTGYDHKTKAITARGAWVCVRRHFWEFGLDPEQDPVTVVGIGDMGGDVFGNGMLLSRSMKLVAAFNHKHVFLDPDPDPERSFRERERLFQASRGGWDGYDPELISPGGGVYNRNAKAIDLSERAQRLLGTSRGRVSGEELVRLILCAEVDLLWNGGIGTYVKGHLETDHDVEDQANDAVRVDASELRCRVVGEGGNLGFTQRGRIEFAQHGGRLNLDAIDNSGGVDLSDHEVNIKILLQPAVRDGRLSLEDRNARLAAVGDEVCDRVLDDSRSQSLAISLDELRSERDIWTFQRTMEFLKRRLDFSRRRERLPHRVEHFEEREARGEGLLRPELGKLLSFSKMYAREALAELPVGTDDELRPWMAGYFPDEVVEAVPEGLDQHLLFKEIAATEQVNHIVDMAGATFFPHMVSTTERRVRDVAAAYLLAEELLEAGRLRRDVRDASSRLGAVEEYDALLRLEGALVEAARGILELHLGYVTLAHRPELAEARRLLEHLDPSWEEILPEPVHRELATATERYTELGLEASVARQLALLRFQVYAPAITALARSTGADAGHLAEVYFAVAHSTRVLPLVTAIDRQVHRLSWDALAASSLRQRLFDSVRRLTALLARSGRKLPSGEEVERGLATLPELRELREDIDTVLHGPIPMSATFVLSDRLRRRIDGMESQRGG